MGSLPPSEDGGDGWVDPPRPRLRAATGQVQMSRRDRQQVYIVQDIARELENNQPGSIHEVKFVFSGRRLQASIVFDRHRGTEACDGAAQRCSRADGASAPTGSQGSGGSSAGQQPRQLPSPRASAYQGPPRPIHSARLGAAQPQPRPDRAVLQNGRDRPTAVADLSKEDVNIIERTIKATITPIVREMGGDEKDGTQFLSPPVKIPLGRFKTGPIRVPKGSRAYKALIKDASKFAENFGERVLERYLTPSQTSKHIELMLNIHLKPQEDQMVTT